jgi:hypothetical protein
MMATLSRMATRVGVCAMLGGGAYGQAPAPSDPWFNAPASYSAFPATKQLAQADIAEVAEANIPVAVQKLSDVAFAELSNAAAVQLVGRPFAAIPGTRLFLVRGLSFGRGGVFSVIPAGGDLLVQNGVLSRLDAPMRRLPVVVRLAESPGRVFVVCSSAS